MNTYTTGHSRTGHYRKPGDVMTYCGRHGIAQTSTHTTLCKTCVKAEARDRAEALATATAALTPETTGTLPAYICLTHGANCDGNPRHQHSYRVAAEVAAEKALAQSLTPKMRAVLPAVVAAGTFRDNGLASLPKGVTDPSLQGLIRRGLAERYDTGETFAGFEGGTFKIWNYRATDLGRTVAAAITAEAEAEAKFATAARAVDAVEHAEETGTAAETVEQTDAEAATNAPEANLEDLTDTVACPACQVAAGARCVIRAGTPAREPHGRRFEALEQAAGITEHRAAARREAEARGGWVAALDRKAEDALLTAYAARIAEARLDAVKAEADEQFARAARAVDAVEHAEQVEAAVETVEQAEAIYAAQLVTEAEATEGTWRGEWIGTTDTTHHLFPLAPDREQGALFA